MDNTAQRILDGNFNLNGPSSRNSLAGPSTSFGPNDLFIAVMGVTGSGKSTFISQCCSQVVPIGHGLQSHTSEIQIYSMKYSDKTIHLIDTPGFDDTYKPDVDVLKDISYWLNKSYKQEIRLTGVIYLHRIIDPRLGGTARKNLEMFKRLCGEDSFKAVVLATTMWEKVSPDEGDRRERELRTSDEFYGAMLRNGAVLKRHLDNKTSAMAIVLHLVNRGRTTVLKMQVEMSEQGLELQETSAGKELDSEILQQAEAFNTRLKETEARMQQALREKDNQLAKELSAQQDELNQRILAAHKGREELQVTMAKLFEEKEKQFNEMKKQYEEDRKQNEEALIKRDEQLEDFRKALKKAEELAQARTKEYEEEIERKKKQLDEAEKDTLEMYVGAVAAILEQKQQYEQKVAENLLKAREEQNRQEKERMKVQYETELRLAQERQYLAQQPAFYSAPPAPPQHNVYPYAHQPQSSPFDTGIIAGGAAGMAALAPIAAMSMGCSIM